MRKQIHLAYLKETLLDIKKIDRSSKLNAKETTPNYSAILEQAALIVAALSSTDVSVE